MKQGVKGRCQKKKRTFNYRCCVIKIIDKKKIKNLPFPTGCISFSFGILADRFRLFLKPITAKPEKKINSSEPVLC
jgi:hypothetical protein